MKVNIKLLDPSAVIPSYAKPGDAGMDLIAIERFFDEYGNVVYKTGISLEIPEGFMGLIFPRSSVSKYELSLANSVGVIDSGYRGELICKFKPTGFFATDEKPPGGSISDTYDFIAFDDAPDADIFNVGDKIAQLIILPVPPVEFVEVTDLSISDRGDGGFGSTGK